MNSVDGKPLLYRSLHINRGADVITTWCYPLSKRVAFTYSDVKKRYDPAFTTRQVCDMLGRGRTVVELAIINGDITEPQYTYGLNEHKRKYKHMWHESNIMELHDYLLTIHRGRPRLDGLITPVAMPTKKEIRAMIRQDEVLYVKNNEGSFVPVWRAEDF